MRSQSYIEKQFSSPDLPERPPQSRSGLRNWSRKTWLVVGGVAVVIIIATVAGAVLGVRANAYPDYSKINYALKDTYAGSTFFDNFEYFTGFDPTHGFVHYVDKPGSFAQNLTLVDNSTQQTNSLSSDGSSSILRVDISDKNATTGRRSVRITSKQTYSKGLFIFDIIHSPFGCATWPALWVSDQSNWPRNGEIDVVESTNVGNTGNQMTLHTTDNCKIGKGRKRKQTGQATSYDCFNGTNNNEGCSVTGPANSFGQAFNSDGGGVYAMELRTEGIRIWMFGRNSIPADITSKNPDPSTWPTALADFPNLECDIGSHFKNMSIVANIDLCGDLAGQPKLFNQNAMCTGTCSDWVAFQANSFDQAYWEFGGFWVYEGK